LGCWSHLKELEVSTAALYAAQKNNNGDSGTAAASCNAPHWSVLHYIVPREKSAPRVLDAAFHQTSSIDVHTAPFYS